MEGHSSNGKQASRAENSESSCRVQKFKLIELTYMPHKFVQLSFVLRFVFCSRFVHFSAFSHSLMRFFNPTGLYSNRERER